jgi:hypothetical protein
MGREREREPSIDTEHPPLGDIAARRLVDALAAQTDDRAERHYLEVKSDVDLRATLGAAKVAKFILGAANRPVELASRAFAGYAVLVIGVAPGRTPGVPPIEAGEIETRVRPYLSASGPRWDIIRVAVATDRDVLLIVVDPPQQGQGPFLCWKEFSPDGEDRKHGLRNGSIYVRDDLATRPATAEEVVALVERGRGGRFDVDLDVQLTGVAIRPPKGAEKLMSHVVRAVDGLLAILPGPEPATTERRLTPMERAAVASALDVMARVRLPDMFASAPEDRSVEEYTAEVEDWANEARDAIPEFLEHLAATAVQPVGITIANRARTYFEDAELTIHLEGDVEGVEPRDGRLGGAAWPPATPRPWGPRSRMESLGHFAGLSVPAYPSVAPFIPSRFTWENGGSITGTWDVGDLRPKEVVPVDEDEQFIVIVRDPAIEVVRGGWTLTARGHHEVYDGTLELPVAEDAGIDEVLDEFLARISRTAR